MCLLMDGLECFMMFLFSLNQVQAAIRSSSGNKASLSEGVEASVIYVRFKAAANEVTVSLFGQSSHMLSLVDYYP